MNRRFLALMPWMAIAGAAWGQTRSADVLYTSRSATPVHAFRVGDECFVPLDGATYWGWRVARTGDVALVTAEGRSVSVPARIVGGQPCIALRRAVELLGADSEWVGSSDNLQVYAPLASLSLKGGKVGAKAPLSIKATGYTLSGPDRAVVDFEGARLTRDTRLDLPKGAKATQFRPNVVRLTVEVPFVPVALGAAGKTGREVQFELKPVDGDVLPPDESGRNGPPPVQKTVDTPPIGSEEPAEMAVTVLTDIDGKTVVQIPLAGRIKGPATFAMLDATTLEVTLPFVQGFLAADFVSPTLTVPTFEATRRGFDTVLTLHLARPLGAAVTTSPEGVQISLVPVVAGGPLSGKVIVVDPGHGGHDTGAKSGGAIEKQLALAVSKLLTEELTKAGATVIMTRQSDVFIPLEIRSDISNRNHADMFVAIHINSTARANSQSGTISFHHLKNVTGRTLAEAIQAEMAKVTGLPNKGVWSDGRIYDTGFAVLRNTRQRAAVLLELGFINHGTDRARMLTADFQTKIAAAIARGVRKFFGDKTQ